jgi:pimeloyl-ACP methyl ester carboxylesterase
VPPNPPDPTGEPSHALVRQILEEQLYHHELITDEIVEARYQSALGHKPRPSPPAAAAAEAGQASALSAQSPAVGAASAPPPLWQRLGELKVPLMLLYGAEDRGSVPERAQILADHYPGITVQVVPHAKHLLQWDAEQVFNAAAQAFFHPDSTNQ